MVVVPNVVHMLVNLQEMTKTNLLRGLFLILQLAGVLWITQSIQTCG